MEGAWPGSERALAERLRADRDAAGMKQADVAQRVGISDALLGHYETGERPPKYEHLQKWLRTLGRPTSWADDWVEWIVEERLVEVLGQLRQTTRGPLPQEDIDALRRSLRNAMRGRGA